MKELNGRVKAVVVRLLKAQKGFTEREVKARVARELRVGSQSISTRVIRNVRRSLSIDRPRAVAWARRLLERTPRLEAKKVIAEVSERFGIRLSPPDVTRLRPAGARQKRAPKGTPRVAPVKTRRASAISITYHANGDPDDVALFFRTLSV